MKFMDLLDNLENYSCVFDLEDVEVEANKVGNLSLIYFKKDGVIFDCIILSF